MCLLKYVRNLPSGEMVSSSGTLWPRWEQGFSVLLKWSSERQKGSAQNQEGVKFENTRLSVDRVFAYIIRTHGERTQTPLLIGGSSPQTTKACRIAAFPFHPPWARIHPVSLLPYLSTKWCEVQSSHGHTGGLLLSLLKSTCFVSKYISPLAIKKATLRKIKECESWDGAYWITKLPFNS